VGANHSLDGEISVSGEGAVMSWMRATFARLGELLYRRRREQELAEEIESHLQLHIDDNLRSGMDPVEARRQALIKFGGMDSTVEAYRAHRGFSFGGTVWQDLRYAARMLRKSPGFTVAVVLSLALGIGANTAIFSLIDAVMLKFLPVRNPEQLVLLKWASPRWPDLIIHQLSGTFGPDKTGRSTSTSFSYPTFKELGSGNTSLTGIFAFADTGKLNLNADGEAGLAEGELASSDYFSVLGVKPIVGRLFSDFDDKPDSQPTAVISYSYWDRRFGRDPSIVGKTITINAIPATVIGVASSEFFGLQPGTSIDLWVPLKLQPQVKPMWTRGLSKFLQRDDWWLQIMGRLKPGVDEKSALAQLGVVFRQSSAEPDYTGEKSRTSDPSKLVSSQAASLALESIPANRGLGELRERFSKPLFILMAAVALVLLIACANVTNLLSARATSRHKEIAVRLAIGAGRKRLIRQLLTESVLLATFGGIFGLLLAYLATHLLVNLMSRGQKLIALNIQLDLHVLGFTAVISLVTGVLFGLVPALRGTHLDLTPALKEDSKGLASNKRSALLGLTKVLVVSQVALSLLLLAGAGLFIRTLVNLETISLGFDSQNILLFGIDPTQKGYKGEKLSEFYEELEHRIESLPGVRSASFSMLGQIGAGGWNENISIEGYVARRGESGKGSVDAHLNGVGPRFLNTMGIPLLLGRSIEETDKGSAPKVAVVNETFARDYLDTSSPIGRRFGFGKKSRDFEVIGIAADTKYDDLRRETPPLAYLAAPKCRN
jgi:predicted permease